MRSRVPRAKVVGGRRALGLRALTRPLRRGAIAFRPRALPLAISVLATAAIYALLSHTAEPSRDLGEPGRASMAPLAGRHIEPGRPLLGPPPAR